MNEVSNIKKVYRIFYIVIITATSFSLIPYLYTYVNHFKWDFSGFLIVGIALSVFIFIINGLRCKNSGCVNGIMLLPAFLMLFTLLMISFFN